MVETSKAGFSGSSRTQRSTLALAAWGLIMAVSSWAGYPIPEEVSKAVALLLGSAVAYYLREAIS